LAGSRPIGPSNSNTSGSENLDDVVDVEPRRAPPAERRRVQQRRSSLGPVSSPPVRGDLVDEVVGEITHRQGDEQHDRESLRDRRRRQVRGAGGVDRVVAAGEHEPARDRAPHPEADRALDRGQHQHRPVGRLRARVIVLRERHEQHHRGVGEELQDVEEHAFAGVPAFGEYRDEVDRPEGDDQEHGSDMGERAGAPEPHEDERAGQPPDASERGLHRNRARGLGEIDVRYFAHFPLGHRPGRAGRTSALRQYRPIGAIC
jgi:hypothetical protein